MIEVANKKDTPPSFLREALTRNEQFYREENIFFQKGLVRPGTFEQTYLALRARENRLYNDELVNGFPTAPSDHPLRAEWSIRKNSTTHLVSHLGSVTSTRRILDVGCGNGWLSNYLVERLPVDICAVDVNETELKQAARLFDRHRLSFLYGNVLDSIFSSEVFDVIILASSVQYFPDLNSLIHRLLQLVKRGGEIHVLDSPVYKSVKDSKAARERSLDYFNSIGFPTMADRYFHPTFDALAEFNISILYDPGSLKAQFQQKVMRSSVSPFPWIQIRKG